MGSIRRFQPGRSPFDAIMNVEDDGTPWWSARQMMELMGYADWRNMESVIRRARSACRNSGKDPADHFVGATRMVDIGSGTRRAAVDVHMTRYGCYLLAMNGDPTKPEIAAAQSYFALMTRAAEKGVAVPAAVISSPRPWSQRFAESTQAHFCYVNSQHPGFFSVVSAAVAQMLMMEEELIRHLLPLNPSDLPDGSIGSHWSKYRWTQGLKPSTIRAPLLLPDRGIDAGVLLYPVAEMGDFLAWLNNVYIPEHLPNYYANKPEFRPAGHLPPASAADHTSQRLTGRPAKLEPRIRRQLESVGGFCPVGKKVPQLGGGQRALFEF